MDDDVVHTLKREYRVEPVKAWEPYMPTAGVFQLLLHFGVPMEKAREVSECGERFAPVHCQELPHLTEYVAPVFCRIPRLCGRDDNIERYSQADDMLLVLRKLFERAGVPLYVFAVDFTLARDVWNRVKTSELPELGRLAYSTVQEYFRNRFPMRVRFGMNVSVQMWHSSNPGEGYYPHVHSIVPRLFYRDDLSRVRTEDKMLWLDHEQIKTIWRRKVEECWGKSEGRFKHREDMFSCRVQVRLEDEVAVRMHRRGIKHRLRYMYRGFALDVAKHVNRGYDYAGWDEGFVRHMLLNHNHKRNQSYGILAAKNLSGKSRFMRTQRLDLGTKRERKHVRKHHECPKCGGNVYLDIEARMSRKEAVDAGKQRLRPVFHDEGRWFLKRKQG